MSDLDKFYKMFDMEISACGGQRAEFIRSMRDDLQSCDVVSLRELFSEEQISIMKRMVNKKECFKNAYNIAECFSTPGNPIRYVEGRVLVGGILPIEHAWNKVGGKFFDATFELALGYDVTKESYALLREYDVDKVREILLEKEYYGEIYRDEKFKEFFNK